MAGLMIAAELVQRRLVQLKQDFAELFAVRITGDETLSVNLAQRADEGVSMLVADFAILVAVAIVETCLAHAALHCARVRQHPPAEIKWQLIGVHHAAIKFLYGVYKEAPEPGSHSYGAMRMFLRSGILKRPPPRRRCVSSCNALDDPQTRIGSDCSAGPPIPPVDMMFRPAAVNNVQVPGDRPSIGRRAVRAFSGFLLTACIGGAGVAWQSYGDAAKQIIASSAPQHVLTSWMPLEKLGLSAQPAPPAVQAADANAAPPQPAAPAQTAPEDAAVVLYTESTQLLQSMVRDLASVGQEIEQIKVSIEQIKASQQQMPRDVAKPSEQNRRPRISAPPPRSAAAPAPGAHVQADQDARDHALPWVHPDEERWSPVLP